MSLATLILVLASHAGYWVGGHDHTIELRWAVQGGLPNALVAWDLSAANTSLASGQVDLPAGESAKITLAVPKVRAPVEMTFACRIVARDDGRELSTVRRSVFVYPDDLSTLKDLVADRPLLVVDDADRLPALLRRADARFGHAADMSSLLNATEPILIIGEGKYDPDHAATLVALAERGATVIVLRQREGVRVLQYERVMRDAEGYAIETSHPLLRHLAPEGWRSMLQDHPRHPALAIPDDEAALQIIHSPIESGTARPGALDALLLTRSTGTGRLVLCQLPLDQPLTDARQRQLLINLLEYARTRPQPTPSRPQRLAETPKKPGDNANLIGDDK